MLHGSVMIALALTCEIPDPSKQQQQKLSTHIHWFSLHAARAVTIITLIIQYAYLYMTSHHQCAVHIKKHRIQSKIFQSANRETTAWLQIDFMSRGGSKDICFIMPNQLCRSGQWAGPLDLYGKEDAPALHESPSYGWNSWCQHGTAGRMSS